MHQTIHSFRFCFILLLLAIGVSLLQHGPHLNTEIQGVHGIRQAQTVWNIRNFVRHDANIFNPRSYDVTGFKSDIQRREFPIMQWSIAMVQKVTGESILTVRLSIFLICAFSVLGMFFLVHRFTNSWPAALLTAVLLQYSPVFYYYAINPLPDHLALAAAIWYVYFIVTHRESQRRKHLWAASLCLLLATLAKLPYLMFAIVSIVYFLMDLFGKSSQKRQPFAYAGIQLLTVAPALAWYAWVIPTWTDNPVLTGGMDGETDWELIRYLLKWHYDKMFPYLITIPPMWVPFWIGLIQLFRKAKQYPWIWALAGITCLFLALELQPIYTNHDYYLMPFFAWLLPVMGLGFKWLLDVPYLKYITPAFCIWAALYAPSRTDAWWGVKESWVNEDILAYSEELKAAVPRDALCLIMSEQSNDVVAYRIDKRGHAFTEPIPVEWVNDLVSNHNINYLYSTLEEWHNSAELVPYVDSVLLARGSVKVLKLKSPEPTPPPSNSSTSGNE
ncbi:glycosyltransferase family 39 protein [Lewinella sp. 4G2]|uniref:ArnT family glycosyltransferase n=1 Tax=Lewinella sp. 4G2 TaxID=1803372 RepID=UPI0007B4E462|nr:glycosyltransferase family 39 protein [Lewinella sp. 4G2]OAV44457.1 hypothetical protein A3850_008125 [Lewinella sp. 4G2]